MPNPTTSAQGRWMSRAGWACSALTILGLTLSAAMKLQGAAALVANFTGKFGYPAATLAPLGALELGCTALYALPRTRVLGAVLLTGYLGGAVATHLRIGENPLPGAVLGAVAWLGLWLRDPRLRALLPLTGHEG